ncbi:MULTISPECIES: MurR/RpiR family transcriptional regulator [Halomonas]|uniref:MurR/RpiR family transcriptional regulator n=1 Tax=Halomonas TaxID=2745 RepID=UPI001C97D191|nr:MULTISPECIES: MurR/RpiR family transcriptional regulator [Halomonas]MBY6206216.1 MurR/RpiR family transcriptional regulator [Halomonas sp. DP3Y7-2]MBY6227893.1 MurR/RpiR family transcriptional regulator [Halomonas sp. DP3Y7-1]MCA0915960.1 MurR/RpiR family transcriptional regulator [Halomonas denitrificans]
MSDTTKSPSLEARLRAHQQQLPPAERRLAELLLNFPGDISRYGAGELADAAGTSRAAASRLFRRLGYRDFNEARQQVRDAQRWGSPLYLSSSGAVLRETAGQTGDVGQEHATAALTQADLTQAGLAQPDLAQPDNVELAAHLAQEQDNLARSLTELDSGALSAAVTGLSAAHRIHVVGFRNSQMLASLFQRQLQLLRADVQLLPKAGQTLGEDLVDIGEGDMLILVALRRRTGMEQAVLTACHQKGAKSLLVTDPSCPMSLTSTWRIEARVASSSPFDSYTSCLSLIQAICTTYYRENMSVCQERLRRVEDLHEDLSELTGY